MSNPNVDLETVIEDSISDSQLPEDTETVETPEVEEVAEEVPEIPADEVPAEEVSDQVETPATAGAAPGAKDEFERIAGMPAVGPMGRENRIPYSRVKKITEKAVGELAEAVLGRKLNAGEKAADVVKAHVAQIPEMTARITDYEGRLKRVAEFEDTLVNKPREFMTMLQKVPAYQEFFNFLRTNLRKPEDGSGSPQAGATATQATQAAMSSDMMPEPDQELSDGTKVYSLDGLKNLLIWNSKDTEQRVLKQVESNYAPIRQEWQQRRHYEAVIPQVRAQIEEAKTWPMFTENEEEIANALSSDETLTLEGAYRKVVFPKVLADRNTMRQQVLQEVRQAPKASAIPTKPTTPKPQAAPQGPRSLEDVIREQIKTLPR
jgi:hypothetical protein